MRQLFYISFILFILSCDGKGDKNISKTIKIKEDTVLIPQDTRKKEVINMFNEIARHLKLQRLDSIKQTPNQVEYRITLLTGPHTALPFQGVCFHIISKTSKVTFQAYHFGFDKNSSKGKPFQIDTIFKTVTKDFDKEYYEFSEIIRGAYLDDHIEFNESKMSTGPTYLCIEKHNLWYQRVIKEQVWAGNFKDLVDLCFKSAKI